MITPLPTSPVNVTFDERASMHRIWWLLFLLGLVLVIVGVAAIGSPYIATSKSMVVIGVLLVIAGITEVIHAVMVRNLGGFGMHMLGAALYLLVGVFVIEDPIRAATVITLLLAASFFVGGVLRIIFSLVEHFPAWQWVLLTGVVDLILGILIFREWPESSLWVIGLFVGIDLILHGWSWMLLGLVVRRHQAAQAA
jgi:uncharacterized membrane protein HdeD (DUF308 family)